MSSFGQGFRKRRIAGQWLMKVQQLWSQHRGIVSSPRQALSFHNLHRKSQRFPWRRRSTRKTGYRRWAEWCLRIRNLRSRGQPYLCYLCWSGRRAASRSICSVASRVHIAIGRCLRPSTGLVSIFQSALRRSLPQWGGPVRLSAVTRTYYRC